MNENERARLEKDLRGIAAWSVRAMLSLAVRTGTTAPIEATLFEHVKAIGEDAISALQYVGHVRARVQKDLEDEMRAKSGSRFMDQLRKAPKRLALPPPHRRPK